MSGDIDIPKVGKVDKKILIPIVVVAVAFVGYRFYVSGNASGGEEVVPESEFADGGTEPSYIGPVAGSPAGEYDGDGSTPDTGSTDSYGFNGTTNAQWTQYVSTQLSQSDSYSYSAIVEALGNYLGGVPLSTAQQSIVRAAIALGGYPPVGSHVIVPGGNTAITVAPSGLKVASTTSTQATLTFNPVAGASGYKAFRGAGSSVGSSTGTTIVVSGLTPNTTYHFNVVATSASGASGPHSASVTGKTKGVTLARPNTPKVSSITKTSAHVTSNKIANATGYNWYINGVAHGHSDGPAYTVSGLKTRTTYRLTVAGDTATANPGPQSPVKTFKTK